MVFRHRTVQALCKQNNLISRCGCAHEGSSVSEVKGGSRRRQISRIQLKIARELLEGHGVPMAIVAREVATISRRMKALLS